MFYAVYEKATGKLLSVGSVLGKIKPENAVKELGDSDPTQEGMIWDEKTLSFKMGNDPFMEAFVNKILALPELNELTTTLKTSLKDKLIKILYKG